MQGWGKDARHYGGVFIHHAVEKLVSEVATIHVLHFVLFYQLSMASDEILRGHLHRVALSILALIVLFLVL